jgi:hypothetical protein
VARTAGLYQRLPRLAELLRCCWAPKALSGTRQHPLWSPDGSFVSTSRTPHLRPLLQDRRRRRRGVRGVRRWQQRGAQPDCILRALRRGRAPGEGPRPLRSAPRPQGAGRGGGMHRQQSRQPQSTWWLHVGLGRTQVAAALVPAPRHAAPCPVRLAAPPPSPNLRRPATASRRCQRASGCAGPAPCTRPSCAPRACPRRACARRAGPWPAAPRPRWRAVPRARSALFAPCAVARSSAAARTGGGCTWCARSTTPRS